MRVSDDTPCNICSDELGMDSGHHVQYGMFEGHPCHWQCIAGALEGVIESMQKGGPGRCLACEKRDAKLVEAKAKIESHARTIISLKEVIARTKAALGVK